MGRRPSKSAAPGVELQPVYFDGDVQIDGLVAGGHGGRVPSKGMLGYVQLKPRGEPISPKLLRDLLISQFGSHRRGRRLPRSTSPAAASACA